MAAVIAISIALWIGRRGKENKRFLSWLGVFLTLYLLIYKSLLALNPEFDFHIWNELPLQPCNIIAILLIFVVRMKESLRGRALKGFCFYGGIVFAGIAMMMPVNGFSDVPLLSVNVIGFYGFHGLLLVLAVSLTSFGVYRPRYKDIPWVLLALAFMGLLAHGINKILRISVYREADYFYTYGIEGNVVMDTLMEWIPVELLWTMPLLFIMAVLCIVITFVADILIEKNDCEKRRKGVYGQ